MNHDGPGWVVLDPAGNVVDSGPGMSLEMVSTMGDREVSDVGDRPVDGVEDPQ